MPRGRPKEDPIERFWKYVQKGDGLDACWLWVGSRDGDGYGKFYTGGRLATGSVENVGAHRFAYELLRGPIPTDKPCVLHNCPNGDEPGCVNPRHLWCGTVADNNADKIAKGRQRGAAPGEAHVNAKLTRAQVVTARVAHLKYGITQRLIAARYGVHHGTISAAITGPNWRTA